jgi:hypothetical protein
MAAAQKIKRYPSIRSFEKNEAGLFFGREVETQQLFNKVLAEKEVLLFARSGIGKSSLLNAGLIPLLEKRGFLTLPVRLNKEAAANAQTPVDLVKNALEPYFDKTELPAGYPHEVQLWEYLKCCSFPLSATPVLILDQFEQFFYNDAETQKEFMLQLAELVQQYEPPRVANWYSDMAGDDEKRANAWFIEQPVFKVVIAIRSDRLYELNRLAQYMPTILRNRFELQPLQKENAEKAIIIPAGRQDDALYQSPHFTYQEPLKETIIRNLEGKNGIIETTQLQIVCSEIENRVLLDAEGKPARPAGYEVSLGDIDAIGGIQKIIDEFYGNQVAKAGDEKQVSVAKAFIENELYDAANNGRRIVFETEAKKVVNSLAQKKEAGYVNADALLTSLLDLRLVREDLRESRKFYEISHDYLLSAIGKAYETAKVEKEKVEAEKKNAVLLKEIQNRRRRQRSTYLLLGISLAALIVAAVLYLRTTKQKEKYKDVIAELYTSKAKERLDNYDYYQAYNLLCKANENNRTEENDTLLSGLSTQVLAGVHLEYHQNNIISTLTSDSILYIWNCATRPFTLLKSFNKPGEFYFSADGSKLFILDTSRQITVWKWGTKSAELHGSFDVSYRGVRTGSDSVFYADDGNTILFLSRNSEISGYTFENGRYTRLPNNAGFKSMEKMIQKRRPPGPTGDGGESRLLSSSGAYLIYTLPNYLKRKNTRDAEFYHETPTYDIYRANVKNKESTPVLIAKNIPWPQQYNTSGSKLYWQTHDGTVQIYNLTDKTTTVCTTFKKRFTAGLIPVNYHHLIKGNLLISSRNTAFITNGTENLIVTDWVMDTLVGAYKSNPLSETVYFEGAGVFIHIDTANTMLVDIYSGKEVLLNAHNGDWLNFRMLSSGRYAVVTGDSIFIKEQGTSERYLANNLAKSFEKTKLAVWQFKDLGLQVFNETYIAATKRNKTILFFPYPVTADSLGNMYPPLRKEEKLRYRIDE